MTGSVVVVSGDSGGGGGTWGQISLSEENVRQHFINILCPDEGRQAETLTKSLLIFQ